MSGRGGNNGYSVDHAGDRVYEVAGQGLDTIFTSVSCALSANAVFTRLAPGALSAAAFHTGAAAPDADDRIIYNKATGALFHEYDGTGDGAAVQFASVQAGLTLSADDFAVI